MATRALLVEFRLLGPVQLWAGGREWTGRWVRPRSVLAALALEVNDLVTVDRLVDAVWDERSPRTARNSLQALVSQVRRVLTDAGADHHDVRVDTYPAGYVLRADPQRVDVHRFRALVTASSVAAAGGDLHRAVGLARRAVRIWRGVPLEGLTGDWAARVRERLRHDHAEALAARFDLELRLGRHAEVIDDLHLAVAGHPLAELLTGQLMVALYRTGRQAEALERYAATRRYLVTALGDEPGRHLQQIHQRILRRDPELAAVPQPPAPPAAAPDAVRTSGGAAAPGGGAVSGGTTVSGGAATADTPAVPDPSEPSVRTPSQLPAGIAAFCGRAGLLRRLDALLAEEHPAGPAVTVAAIAGTAGVGKTALALHWAHRVADRFPDGHLYVNLRGFDPAGATVKPAEAVRGFLDALGVPPQRMPVGLEAQAGLYRSLLAGKRMLIVLDNARDADQVRPLLPGSPGCMVVVTSRDELTGLITADGARPLTLDVLTGTEARELLAGRLGRHRVAAEARAVDDIVAACARLPLALAIVAARAATHPGFPLAVLADELDRARGGLDAFDVGDAATDVRAVFSWSYRTLSPESARLFRLMGVHPGPDIAISAAASLAGVPSDRVRPLLAELARAHLIDEHAPGRFAFHDLLRAYAGELARLREPDAERRAALLRVLDYYLHTARAADRWLYPYRDEITLTPPGPGVTPDHITDQAHAMTWFTAEHVALRAAVALAADAGFPVHAMRTAWCLVTFFDRQGYWHAQVATQRVALGAARRLADRKGQADHHRGLGLAHLRLGRYPDADTHLRQALDLFADLGDRPGQARTHRDLAYLSWLQDRNQQALHHIEQALDVSHTAGHRAGSAYALNAHGWYHSLRGEHGRAIEFYRRACALFQEADDRVGQAVSWEGRGHALRHLGHHGQATVCYRRAFDLWREAGDRYHQADTTERLGDLHDAVGDSDAARGAWQRALTILDELGHPDADRLRAKVRHLDDRPDDRRPDDRRSDDRRPDDRRRGRRR